MGISFNVQEIDYSKDFSYVSKDMRNTKIPISQKEFDTLTQIAELKKISNKNKKLRIEYHNALGTQAAKKIIRMFS